MFKKINLYTRLFTERMEALLAEDALEDDHKTFDSAVRILTLRDYDYLDFRCVLRNSIFVYAKYTNTNLVYEIAFFQK